MIEMTDIMKIADLIFSREYAMFKYLYDSYDTFLEQMLHKFLEEQKHIISTDEDGEYIYVHYLIFSKILIEEPYNENTNERIYPMIARQQNLTYQIRLFANVSQHLDKISIKTQEKQTRQIGETVNKMLICNIPLMVRSKRCSLNIDKIDKYDECKYDPGGYFIIKGSEKVLINQDIRINNKPIITHEKINGVQLLVVKVSSKTYTNNYISQIITIIYENNGEITLNIPILNKVNVIVIFKVLGLITDKSIVEYILHNNDDPDMMALLTKCIQMCINDKGKKINTSEDALDYLLLKTKVPKKNTDSDPIIKLKQQKQHLMDLLTQNLFPHITGTKMDKAIYLGYVIRKLLLVKLERIDIDEKDSYLNKRVELPGDLMFELFKQEFRKTIGECKKHFEAKNKGKNEDPILIIPQYKPNIIEQGFKKSFAIGNWLKKNGVAQVLSRLSYPQTICSLRRIDTHIGDPKTNKIILPRYFHKSSTGFLCPLQTPEHANIGLTKHLTIISNITILNYEQYYFLKTYLKDNTKSMLNTQYLGNSKYVLVFLNGELIGLTNEYIKIQNDINKMRLITKELNNKLISVVYDIELGELRIYCDSGRFYRPILKVKDNDLLLKKNYLNDISVNHIDNFKGKITSMEEFENKYPDVIDYIDSELQAYVIIASNQKELNKMKNQMNESLKSSTHEKTNEIINRYDNSFFIKYNFCEIHPSLLLGEIVANVPYSNHLYAVRMNLHYAQGKQATGIYNTKYLERLDISSILYNPQRPLITTQASKYTNNTSLPHGENVIIAIMCYTGYNQEDSLIFNKDSIERGKFLADIYKKFEIESMKNQSSGSMDIFTKPDQSLVISKKISYNKLNNEGYCNKGTVLEKGDAIFGKITPIVGTNNELNTKKFRDTSESYNSTSNGIVANNYIDITDESGATIRRALVSSKRIPNNGDKYCSRYGQKSTIGLKLASNDMPYIEKSGLKPDIIINPHGFMSRMACAQIIEMAVGKICLNNCTLGDGTPFEDYDTFNIDQLFEQNGFNNEGTETMIDGETGEQIKMKIFIGPCFYLRLKHLTEDKIHARSRGPRQLLTRQPTEGRSRDGGSRVGEMERDALISLNCAKFIQEKMMNNSDAFIMHICNNCGSFAHRYIDDERNKNIESFPTIYDIYECELCKNKSNISKIRLPYACKLLFQELKSMNVFPRIFTD